MLVIEHHVPLVLRVCDHVYVLNFGQLLAEGQPSVIQTHPEVVAPTSAARPRRARATVETDEDAELDAQLEHAVHEPRRAGPTSSGRADAPATRCRPSRSGDAPRRSRAAGSRRAASARQPGAQPRRGAADQGRLAPQARAPRRTRRDLT
jgi:ABC-type glutathione transport system ATPase component